MAEWLCSGLQSRVRRFDSGFSLNINQSNNNYYITIRYYLTYNILHVKFNEFKRSFPRVSPIYK